MISKFQGRWRPRDGAPLSLREAVRLVRSRGVAIPSYVSWYLPEREGLSLPECGLADADAMYFRIDQLPQNVDFPIRWDELLTSHGQLPVFLRGEILRSDEHCLYVLAHEAFEIRGLRRIFRESRGALTFRRLCFLIDPRFGGAIHEAAVRYGDSLVEGLRRERGG